eukprot:m.255202 g.255202  ORF g.255202 m.255202 type:complete len:153 (+) comp40393_c0_seq14:461-919(+)
MNSSSPVQQRDQKTCRLCGVLCRLCDKTFKIFKDKELLLAITQTLAIQAPTDNDGFSKIICDACKRKVFSAKCSQAAKRKIEKILRGGELSNGPAISSACRICCKTLKSSMYSIKNYTDVFEWIAFPLCHSNPIRFAIPASHLLTRQLAQKK